MTKFTHMNLVIVESPAKCKKISEILGPGFKVLATMGHIRALEEDLDAVGINRDFEPRFRFIKEKSRATAPIMEAAKSAKTIYLAADDDREGEAIAYSVACLLKKDPLSFPRSVFHEITSKAIKEAIANPRRIDMNRVYAQQARSVLDLMVGFTISPLLWKHVAKKLSAGRCQTPALRLVVERENQIKSHTTQTSWALKGKFKSQSLTFDAKMTDDLEDQESAMNYLENVNGDDKVTVKSNTTKPWTASPPKPLITSTLQQEASALHKVNPKSTMKIAQALYEAGHITYMRTDFAILSEEAIQEAQAWVLKNHGEKYVQAPAEKPKAKAKATAKTEAPPAQEAHEAIRPTHFEVVDLPGDWTPVDRKIYALIWKRAVQSTMTAAKGDSITLLTLLNCPDFEWSSQWKRTTFDGWQILGKAVDIDSASDEEESPEAMWKAASSIKPGTPLKWLTLTAEPKRSKASARFTEATLIRELERRGIGRPSTFASLVETLFDKTYIDKQDIPGSKAQQTTLTTTPNTWPPTTTLTQISLGAEKQKLVPTPLGESVLNFCVKEFPQLFAYEFTAQMERRLDSVSKGDEQWKAICRDTWGSYSEDHKRLSDRASAPSQSEKVNDFGDGFKAVMSKSGPLLVIEGKAKADKPTFYTLPKDTNILEITKEEALEFIRTLESERRVGEFDGKTIIKKKGPYGEYLECGTYKVPFIEEDTMETILAKFNAKKESASKLTRVGPYIFTVGQYGPYMYKENVKKKNFVSVPATIDPKRLTLAEAEALYKSKQKT
jgi:DNA topoisomerase I